MDPQNKEVRQCPIFDPKYYTHWSSLVPGPPWGKGPGDKANTGGMQLLHVYFCILHQIREEDLKWAQELVKQKEATKEQSETKEDGSEGDRSESKDQPTWWYPRGII